MRPPSKPRLAGIVATLGAVTVVASGSAVATTVPDDDEPPEIVILDEGKGDELFDLDQPMVVGTTAHAVETTATAGSIEVTGAQTLDAIIDVTTTIEQSAEVTAVEPDGSYTINRVVDSYSFVVTEGPRDVADGFQDSEELEPLLGIPLVQRYDADGRVVSIEMASGVAPTEIQQESIDELIEDGSDRPQFPDVAIGVGAVWTSEMPGTDGNATARFELTSIENGVATIELTFEGDPTSFDSITPPGFDDVVGSMTGTGTYVANIENPIDSTFELAIRLDLTLSGEDLEMALVMDSTTTRVITVD